MKQFIFLLTIMLSPVVSFADEVVKHDKSDVVYGDDDKFDILMESYSSQPGCTTINISNGMLEAMDASIGADYMKVISVENGELIPVFKGQVKELVSVYEVIMSVNNGGESVEIYKRSSADGSITDLYISTSNADSCVLIYIKGEDIALSNIGGLINM